MTNCSARWPSPGWRCSCWKWCWPTPSGEECLERMRFAQPQVLWVLLAVVPALIGFLLLVLARQTKIDPAIRPCPPAFRPDGWRIARAARNFASALLVAGRGRRSAGAGPPAVGIRLGGSQTQQGLDIIVAIDTSRSMLAQDVAPNRLEKAKLAAIDLMRLAKTDRLGSGRFRRRRLFCKRP